MDAVRPGLVVMTGSVSRARPESLEVEHDQVRPGHVITAAFVVICLTSAPFVTIAVTFLNEPLSQNTWPYLYTYWGALIIGAGMFCVAVSGGRLLADWRLVAPALLALLALTSVLWSDRPVATPTEAMLLVLTVMTGIWFGVGLNFREQVWGVVAGLQPTVFASLALVLVSPARGEGLGGWIGVFASKNSLGPAAGLSIVATFALIMISGRRAAWIIGCAAIGVDLVVLVFSRSATAVIAVIAAVTVGAVWLVATKLSSSTAERPRLALVSVALAGFVMVSTAALASLALGKDLTFSDRTAIWEAVFRRSTDRLLLGDGYRSSWIDKSFLDPVYIETGLVFGNAHNSVLEMLLGVGVLGAAAVCAIFVTGLWNSLRRPTSRQTTIQVGFWSAVTVFCLLENLLEAMIVYHSTFWMLLIAAGFAPMARRPDGGASDGVCQALGDDDREDVAVN